MISLIIPARNEASRLPATLERYTAALNDEDDDLEVIVVANECADGTLDAAHATADRVGGVHVRPIEIEDAVGKGGAVLEGLRAARGERVVFADADGATEPASLVQLVRGLASYDVVVGSRQIDGSVIDRPPSAGRKLFSHLFGWSVRGVFRLPIQDTQCGAKAFRRHVAHRLARLVRERGWAFDVDLLLFAFKLGYAVAEVPVGWTEKPGSQLNARNALPDVARSMVTMLLRHGWWVWTSPRSLRRRHARHSIHRTAA